MLTLSRNSLCPCGSGKRFKQCCGAAARLPGGAALPGNARRQDASGPSAEHAAALEQGYRDALQISPDDTESLRELGLLYLRTGRARAALNPLLRAGLLTAWP